MFQKRIYDKKEVEKIKAWKKQFIKLYSLTLDTSHNIILKEENKLEAILLDVPTNATSRQIYEAKVKQFKNRKDGYKYIKSISNPERTYETFFDKSLKSMSYRLARKEAEIQRIKIAKKHNYKDNISWMEIFNSEMLLMLNMFDIPTLTEWEHIKFRRSFIAKAYRMKLNSTWQQIDFFRNQ